MSPLEIVAILALTGYAIYKQTHVSEVLGRGRFKLALIYGIVGLSVGGFVAPQGSTAFALIGISIVLSFVVGAARGFLTPVWVAADGRILRQGNLLTVGLFLGLIVAKFGIGAVAYLDHVQDGAGFGEVMVMIAIMVAVQAEIVWRRAGTLAGHDSPAGPVEFAPLTDGAGQSDDDEGRDQTLRHLG